MESSARSSCSQCHRPLALDSASGLCEACLATAGTIETPRLSPSGEDVANTHTHSPSFSVDSPRLAPAADDATRDRPPEIDVETADNPQIRSRSLPEPPPGYDLIRLLGAGGMGRVYLAREHTAERTVAIKFASAPSVALVFNRFLVEVRSQVKLRHPNIIEVHAAESHGREPFFTMEVASEGSLAEWTKPGNLLAPAEAVRLVAETAEGIAFAHSNRVLHRDIKPSNILLAKDADGRLVAKVSDFGLAKRLDSDDGLTQSGVLGTAAYMPPEAAACKHQDVCAASDVYALGATLYHLLTGRPPFQDEDPYSTMRKVLNDPLLLPRSVNPAIPEELEAIVVKAMEKPIAARYQTAGEFAAALRSYLDGKPGQAPIQNRRRRTMKWLRRHRVRLATTAAAIATAVGLVAATNYLRPDPVIPVAIDPVEEYLASVRADLQAGKTVELIGETGLPKYYRFWLEKGVLDQEPNGICSFKAFAIGLCELSPPDFGIDQYEVSLELQHLRGSVLGAQNSDSVAFYFSHATDLGAGSGKRAHSLFALQYKDFDIPPIAPEKRSAMLGFYGYIEDPTERVPLSETPPIKVGGARFQPRKGGSNAVRPEPGDWRAVRLRVTPSAIKLFWRAEAENWVTVVDWDLQAIKSNQTEGFKRMDAVLPGVSSRLTWKPQLAFGVRAVKSVVAIRKLKIIPLTPKV